MTRPYLPEEVEARVRAAARNRCGYCLSPQHLVMARLEIEHILPLAQGGSNDESNLWLACPLCNRYKCAKTSAVDPNTDLETPLFNPRTQLWNDHFRWSHGRGARNRVGLTPERRSHFIGSSQLLGGCGLASSN
jgi:hypothetical protein